MRALLILSALLLGLTACGSNQTKVESDLGLEDAPDWVNEGSHQTLDDEDGRLFHGVGSSAPVGDQYLQMSVADDRARSEIARMLSSYIETVSTDYAAAVGTGKKADIQQSVSRDFTNVTKVNLAGAKIIGHWKDPKTKIIYSIAELDLEKVKQTVAKTDAMNASVKSFILDNGNTIFDQQTP